METQGENGGAPLQTSMLAASCRPGETGAASRRLGEAGAASRRPANEGGAEQQPAEVRIIQPAPQMHEERLTAAVEQAHTGAAAALIDPAAGIWAKWSSPIPSQSMASSKPAGCRFLQCKKI